MAEAPRKGSAGRAGRFSLDRAGLRGGAKGARALQVFFLACAAAGAPCDAASESTLGTAREATVAAAAPGDPFQVAGPPAAVRSLAASAKAVDALSLEVSGRLRIERVRERMGAVAALSQSATPHLRGKDLRARLWAHALLARSLEALASALGKARTPEEARGAAREAWHAQVEAAVAHALVGAASHWRSCRDLSLSTREETQMGKACGGRLAQLPAALGGGEPETASGDGASVARSRALELEPCYDAYAAAHERPGAVDLIARLSLDEKGRVEAVALAPGDRALTECVSSGLWLWVFPGLSDVELEVPLHLWGR